MHSCGLVKHVNSYVLHARSAHNIQTQMHTQIHTQVHTHACMHVRMHTQACIDVRMHAHTQVLGVSTRKSSKDTYVDDQDTHP